MKIYTSTSSYIVPDNIWNTWVERRDWFPDDFNRENAIRSIPLLLDKHSDIASQFTNEDLWEFVVDSKPTWGNTIRIKRKYKMPIALDELRFESRNNKHSLGLDLGGMFVRYYSIFITRAESDYIAVGKYPIGFWYHLLNDGKDYETQLRYYRNVLRDNIHSSHL